jgi:hypothetical protein
MESVLRKMISNKEFNEFQYNKDFKLIIRTKALKIPIELLNTFELTIVDTDSAREEERKI